MRRRQPAVVEALGEDDCRRLAETWQWVQASPGRAALDALAEEATRVRRRIEAGGASHDVTRGLVMLRYACRAGDLDRVEAEVDRLTAP